MASDGPNMQRTTFTSVLFFVFVAVAAEAQLSTSFYDSTCPHAASIVQAKVDAFVESDRGLAAALMRLHFHDCFVRGCDGSVLLNSTDPNILTEKSALLNNNSLRGFEQIDEIKMELECACPGLRWFFTTRWTYPTRFIPKRLPLSTLKGRDVIDTAKAAVEKICRHVVACAHIVEHAARDGTVKDTRRKSNIQDMVISFFQLDGSRWEVQGGRKDGRISKAAIHAPHFPQPTDSASQLISALVTRGISACEMVVLSGSRCAIPKDTVGVGHCDKVVGRLYKFKSSHFTDPQSTLLIVG
ncbi:hypothetical protein AXG93_2774s1010 [Marchantia polymorpha subsp. ruderalis]|uniref:Peroxidase n=1 Tax=Marchantia polymorpha subsp. ruderalis TaxID=1480154 RepID=A0A176VHI4_MARPO|nr:hypothetical protein AXG93_2774s1010 [Marchantia polymorpha subsp. ruderalis]